MRILLIILPLFASVTGLAQKLPAAYYSNTRKADSLYKLKDYKNAALAYTAAFKANEGKGALGDRYSAAKAWALVPVADSAFAHLNRLVERAFYQDYERVEQEEALVSLHQDKRWGKLIGQMKLNGSFNLGMERARDLTALPDGWFEWGTKDYVLRADSAVKYSGKYAVLIEPLEGIEKKSFGCAAYRIPAVYEGKEIEVTAWVKMENVDQPLGLLLRLDGPDPNKSVGFDNMMKKGILGTKDWTQYSVKLPLAKEARTIFIGVINSGAGKVWCDDFQVLIDGKPIDGLAKKKQ